MATPENTLEVLRNSVPQAPCLDDVVETTCQVSQRVHAAFLFDGLGRAALQTLCLNLSASRNAGWYDLGHILGLDQLVLNCIRNNQSEDPTYNTLLAYSQLSDATLDRIVTALKTMGRLDVINETYKLITELSNSISLNNPLNTNTIIRPCMLPQVPFVFQDLKSMAANTNNETSKSKFNNLTIKFQKCVQIYNEYLEKQHTAMENDKCALTEQQKINKPEISKVILLTYSTDGAEIARNIAGIFRDRYNSKKRIGVLTLEENSAKVYENDQCIYDWCNKVDYIIPIITNEYLNTISNNNPDVTYSSVTNLDARYAKYIFRYMHTLYLRNYCLNRKVRCIIPDHFASGALKHPLMGFPLLQAWVRESEIEILIQRLQSYNM